MSKNKLLAYTFKRIFRLGNCWWNGHRLSDQNCYRFLNSPNEELELDKDGQFIHKCTYCKFKVGLFDQKLKI